MSAVWVFFSFLNKAFVNFEKLIRSHRLPFIVYKNGENLKILIKIFCQKRIVSNAILAFLDHLKTRFFFVGQPWWPFYSATPFKIPVSAPRNNAKITPWRKKFSQKEIFPYLCQISEIKFPPKIIPIIIVTLLWFLSFQLLTFLSTCLKLCRKFSTSGMFLIELLGETEKS